MSEVTIRFYGVVKSGVRKYYRPNQHKIILDSLEGKEFEETLQPKFEKESTDQHGYYRGGIIAATCMQTEVFGGWEKEDIHKFFASKFLSFKKAVVIHGSDGDITEEITVIESTGSIGKKKMTEFISKVLDFLATQDIYPLPPEEYQLNKYQTYVRHTGKED